MAAALGSGARAGGGAARGRVGAGGHQCGGAKRGARCSARGGDGGQWVHRVRVACHLGAPSD